jgi:hypothetical protein
MNSPTNATDPSGRALYAWGEGNRDFAIKRIQSVVDVPIRARKGIDERWIIEAFPDADDLGKIVANRDKYNGFTWSVLDSLLPAPCGSGIDREVYYRPSEKSHYIHELAKEGHINVSFPSGMKQSAYVVFATEQQKLRAKKQFNAKLKSELEYAAKNYAAQAEYLRKNGGKMCRTKF